MDQIRFDSELLLEQCKVLQSLQKRLEDLFNELIIVEKELSIIRENRVILACRSAVELQKNKIAENLNAISGLSAAIVNAVDALNHCEEVLISIADKADDVKNSKNRRNVEEAVLHLRDIVIIPDHEWRIARHIVPVWLIEKAHRFRNRIG